MNNSTFMSGKWKKGTACLVLVLGIGMLSGCGNGVDDFQEEVEKGNYLGARDVFVKHNNKTEFISEVSTYLINYVGGIGADYASGKITADQARTMLEGGYFLSYNCNLQFPDMLWGKLNDCSMDIDILETSKEAYLNGKIAFENGEYLKAADCFELVDGMDSENYNDAVSKKQEAISKFSENVYQTIDGYISSGEEVQAYNYLNELGFYIDIEEENDTDRINIVIGDANSNGNNAESSHVADYLDSKKIEEYQNQVTDRMIQDVINDCENEIAQNGDEIKGIKILDGFYSSYRWAIASDDFLNTAENHLKSYVNMLINEAEDILATGNYKDAIHKASEGLAEFSKLPMMENRFEEIQNMLTEKIDFYKTYIPILLTDTDPIRSSSVSINYVGGWTTSNVDTSTFNQDTNGKEYDSTIMPDGEEGSVTYYLNYQYTRLEGVVYRPYYSIGGKGAGADWYKPGWVKIYGDDVLLYESPKITQKVYDSIAFDLDVSTVRELTFDIGGTWYPGGGHVATVGVADATVSK